MFDLLGTFANYLVWSLILWLVFLAAFAAFFAAGNLTALARGLARLLASIVSSPFVFLRRATQAVIGFDAGQEASYRAGDQYILNKGMMILQAALIIVAIAALSAGTVITWNALVPPSEVRQAARDHRPLAEKQQADAADAAGTVSRLDAAWAERQDAVLTKYKVERQSVITTVSKQMAEAANSLTTYGTDNVKVIFARLQERAGTFADSNPASAKNSLDSFVSNNWYWLDDFGRTSMSRWNQLWLTKATAEAELRNLSMDSLRVMEQPDYPAAAAGNTTASERLRELQATQAQLDEAASLKWKSAVLRLLGVLVSFLASLWTMAFIIEAGWLAIRVAADIRILRMATGSRTQRD